MLEVAVVEEKVESVVGSRPEFFGNDLKYAGESRVGGRTRQGLPFVRFHNLIES